MIDITKCKNSSSTWSCYMSILRIYECFHFFQQSEEEKKDSRSSSRGSSRKSTSTFRISTASSAISTTSSSRSIRSRSSHHLKKRWEKVQRSYVPVEYEVIFLFFYYLDYLPRINKNTLINNSAISVFPPLNFLKRSVKNFLSI